MSQQGIEQISRQDDKEGDGGEEYLTYCQSEHTGGETELHHRRIGGEISLQLRQCRKYAPSLYQGLKWINIIFL